MIVVDIGKEEDLKPVIMDTSYYWTIKLISIEYSINLYRQIRVFL